MAFGVPLPESYTAWALHAAGAVVLWLASVVAYRRYFHPLARIPGPFLPAVTRLYLWYHNTVLEGQYYKRIEEMHAQYGPIVRIAPNEVHLADPDIYDKIYNVSTRFYKDPLFFGTLPMDGMFNTISNEVHRQRRAPLNHFFSRRAVLDLEGLIMEKAGKLCHRLQKAITAKSPLDLRSGFRAITLDVVTQYAFDDCWNYLDRDDFGGWYSDWVKKTGFMWWTFQQFPLLIKPMMGIPESIAQKMNPNMRYWFECVQNTRDHLISIQRDSAAGIKPQRRSVFHEMMDPSTTVYGDDGEEAKWETLTINQMADEALSFCNAAAETTGGAMEMATYHVVTKPEIYAALTKELREAFPDPNAVMSTTALERLPYLTGVIKEGQRLSYGVLSRLARGVPEGGAMFNGYFIPAGATVSMSSYMMHRHPSAFPEPDNFDPTRWTDPKLARVREKCLVPFSRGSRACLGQNLAQCEMYVTLGMLFRRFENLRAVDVGPEDMLFVDGFSAYHPDGSRAFKVVGN